MARSYGGQARCPRGRTERRPPSKRVDAGATPAGDALLRLRSEATRKRRRPSVAPPLKTSGGGQSRELRRASRRVIRPGRVTDSAPLSEGGSAGLRHAEAAVATAAQAGATPAWGTTSPSFNWTGHLATNQESVGSNPTGDTSARPPCGSLAQYKYFDSAAFRRPRSVQVPHGVPARRENLWPDRLCSRDRPSS